MSPIPSDAHGIKPRLSTARGDGGLDGTLETDVVVVGAGAAGLAAANSAAANGCEVVVLDSRDEPGGTTAKSAGGFFVTANRFHREAGIIEDREMTLKLMAKTSFPDAYDPDAERLGLEQLDYELLTTFYDRSSEMAQSFEDTGVLNLVIAFAITGEPRGLPSYYTQLEEETIYYGRTLGPQTADGMIGFGRELISQLLSGAERKGAHVLCGERVVEILRDENGEVTGVATDSNKIFARRGVIFATGGFAHNVELLERHMPGPVLGSCAVSASQGDFISLSEDLDVELAHLDRAWWGEVAAEMAIEKREVVQLLFYPYGDSMIYVNRNGRRVVNEKAVYDQRGPIHFAQDENGEEPNRLLFMIYDHASARDRNDLFPARFPVPAAGDSAPYVIEAPTLEELESKIRERLAGIAKQTGDFSLSDDFGAGLRASIAQFNDYAEKGRDLDFQRGEEPIQVDASGPGRTGSHPNKTMYPISPEGPYYCIITAAGVLDTKGGPRINTKAEVLRKDGTPVPRLYAAGNCAASPSAAAYWTGGTTIGLGMTYGYIAGEEISRLPARAVLDGAVAAAS